MHCIAHFWGFVKGDMVSSIFVVKTGRPAAGNVLHVLCDLCVFTPCPPRLRGVLDPPGHHPTPRRICEVWERVNMFWNPNPLLNTAQNRFCHWLFFWFAEFVMQKWSCLQMCDLPGYMQNIFLEMLFVLVAAYPSGVSFHWGMCQLVFIWVWVKMLDLPNAQIFCISPERTMYLVS